MVTANFSQLTVQDARHYLFWSGFEDCTSIVKPEKENTNELKLQFSVNFINGSLLIVFAVLFISNFLQFLQFSVFSFYRLFVFLLSVIPFLVIIFYTDHSLIV